MRGGIYACENCKKWRDAAEAADDIAWNILVEGLALGADPSRVRELADKWACDDEDAAMYAERVGAIIQMDGNAWCATRKDFENLQESPAGFGQTALEALTELCKSLGYKGSKMWGPKFSDLLAPSKV